MTTCEQQHLLGSSLGMLLMVRDEQHTALLADLLDQVQQQKCLIAFQVGRGLIHHQHRRPGPGLAQNGYGALLHRAQQHGGLVQSLGQLGKAIVLQLFSHPPTPLQWRTVLGPTCFLDQSIQGTGAHEPGMLLYQARQGLHAVGAQRHTQWLSGIDHLPPAAKTRIDRVQSGQRAQKRGFSCTRRTQQCGYA